MAVVVVSAAAGSTAMFVAKNRAPVPRLIKEAAPPVNVAGGDKPSATPTAALGAPDFTPSSENPVGWRGDGSGVFPGATPPLRWGRWPAEAVGQFASQARKPDGAPARPEAFGERVVTNWLVLGPFDCDNLEAGIEKEFVPNESAIEPDVGQSLGGKTWRNYQAGPLYQSWSGSGFWGVDFAALFSGAAGKNDHSAAYAHSYVWMPAAQKARLKFWAIDGLKVWVNGKSVFAKMVNPWQWAPNIDVELQQGWNRVLIKSTHDTSSHADKTSYAWNCQVQLTPLAAGESHGKNIRWTVRLPAGRYGPPTVVGDRIFVMCEPCFLLCFDKNDGKLLWMKSHTNLMVAAEEIKKNNPTAYAEKIEPLVTKVKDMHAKIFQQVRDSVGVETPKKIDDTITAACSKAEWWGGEAQALLKPLVNKDPYGDLFLPYTQQVEPGFSPTCPVSDGKFVYCFHGNAVAACYDFDGKAVWIRKLPFTNDAHHGWTVTPILSGDMLIVTNGETRGLKKATGEEVWHHKGSFTWGSFVTLKIGGVDYVQTTDGFALRVSDGKELTGRILGPQNVVNSSVLGDGAVHQLSSATNGKSTVLYWPIPKTESEKPAPVKVDIFNMGGMGTPVWDDGILYATSIEGIIDAWDTRAHKPIYRIYADMNAWCGRHGMPGVVSSLNIANKLVYTYGNTGTTIVFRPGTVYRQVARNILEFNYNHETPWGVDWQLTNPVPDGRRLYMRTQTTLLCLEYPEPARAATLLSDPDAEKRMQAAEALADLGSEAKPAAANLTTALSDAFVPVRVESAHALLNLDPKNEAALKALTAALSDDYACETAARALKRLGPTAKSAAPALAAACFDKKKYPRRAMIEALEEIDPRHPELTTMCIELIKVRDGLVPAMDILARQGAAAAPAASVLKEMSEDPNPRIKERAEATLKAIHGQ